MKRDLFLWPVFLLLFAAAGFCSFSIDHYKLLGEQPSLDPLSRLLGSSKEALGDTLFLKADSYFHGGARIDAHHDEAADSHKEGLIKEDHDEHEEAAKKISVFDFIARVNEQVAFTKHYHLEGTKVREMLPLLAGAVNLDPYNVDAILTVAYWLDTRLGKTDEAIAALQKGLKDNPKSWELHESLADIYLLKKKDAVAAKTYYEKSLQLMGDSSPKVKVYILKRLSLINGEKSVAL